MPETSHDMPLVTAIQAQMTSESHPSSDQIRREIAPLYPENNFIGIGSESIVVEHPHDPTKVLAVEYKPRLSGYPLEFSEVYNIHKVLSTLFPEHFPHLYAKAQGQNAGSLREKINGNKIGHEKEKPKDVDELVKSYFDNLKEGIKFHNILVEEAKEVGIDLNIDAGTPDNYVTDSDGTIIYLDLVENRSDNFTINMAQAIRRINDRQYPDLDEKEIQNTRTRQIATLVSGVRRIRELAIIKRSYNMDHEVSEQEVERGMADVMSSANLTSDERTHFIAESSARINRTIQLIR